MTRCNTVFHAGKEQSVEKHFNGSTLQALMDSNISASSPLTVLTVQPVGNGGGKSKAKIQASVAIFYIHASQPKKYGGLLSLAKSKEAPV